MCVDAATLQQALLLFQQGLDRAAGGFLSFQEAAVQLGGLFLHLLQDRHAFPGHPQRFCQCIPRNLGLRSCLGNFGRNCRRRGSGNRCGNGACSCCQRWALRFRFDIVGAADRHRHQRLFAADNRWLEIPVPGVQAHLAAQCRQSGQNAGQVAHAGTFAARGIQRQGNMLALTQDGRYQSGQPGARTDLDKQPYSGGVHRFDLGHELDRPGQLPSQQGFGCGDVGRVFGRAAVGIDREPGRVEFDLVKRGQKRHRGIGHQRAVESGCHRQAFAGKFAFGQDLCGSFDLGTAAGQNRLGGGVAVGDHQIETFFGNDLLDDCQRGRNRQHAALVAAAGAHQAAAQSRQFVQHLLVKDTGRAEGGQFTVAVAGGRFGSDPE